MISPVAVLMPPPPPNLSMAELQAQLRSFVQTHIAEPAPRPPAAGTPAAGKVDLRG